MDVNQNLKESFGRKKCTQRLIITESIDRDRWRHVVEVAKVLK